MSKNKLPRQAFKLSFLAFVATALISSLFIATPVSTQTSTDATLSGIEITYDAQNGQGILTPTNFDSATADYTYQVLEETTTITVAPTTTDSAATVSINGGTAVANTTSEAITLTDDSTTITFLVTATDGTTTMTYTITVEKTAVFIYQTDPISLSLHSDKTVGYAPVFSNDNIARTNTEIGGTVRSSYNLPYFQINFGFDIADSPLLPSPNFIISRTTTTTVGVGWSSTGTHVRQVFPNNIFAARSCTESLTVTQGGVNGRYRTRRGDRASLESQPLPYVRQITLTEDDDDDTTTTTSDPLNTAGTTADYNVCILPEGLEESSNLRLPVNTNPTGHITRAYTPPTGWVVKDPDTVTLITPSASSTFTLADSVARDGGAVIASAEVVLSFDPDATHAGNGFSSVSVSTTGLNDATELDCLLPGELAAAQAAASITRAEAEALLCSAMTASTDATLSGLTVTGATLNETFASGTLAYTADVVNSVATITVAPTPTDDGATAVTTVSGTTYTSTDNIPLTEGDDTTITITVTAEDSSTQAYTIVVSRAAAPLSSDATLSALVVTGATLNETFASGTPAYTADVANSVANITVTPTTTDNGATAVITSDGTTYASTDNIPLTEGGDTTITITVTAEDGNTTQTYNIVVSRAPLSSDATLSDLVVTITTLNETFASGTLAYTADIVNSFTSIDVTPAVNDNTATAVVTATDPDGSNLAVTTTAGVSTVAGLVLGANVITITVTAEDSSTQDYTITVTSTTTREAATLSSDSTLSGITLSEGTLTPVFASGTPTYTASVENSVTSIDVTPAVNDNTATAVVTATDPTGTALNVATTAGVSTVSGLVVGANVITITVTAEDSSTQTYTITVTRAAVPATPTPTPTPTPTTTTSDPSAQPPTLGSLVPGTTNLAVTCGFSLLGQCQNLPDFQSPAIKVNTDVDLFDFSIKAMSQDRPLKEFYFGFGLPRVGAPIQSAKASVTIEIAQNPDSIVGYDIVDVRYQGIENPNAFFWLSLQPCSRFTNAICIVASIGDLELYEGFEVEPMAIQVTDTSGATSRHYLAG